MFNYLKNTQPTKLNLFFFLSLFFFYLNLDAFFFLNSLYFSYFITILWLFLFLSNLFFSLKSNSFNSFYLAISYFFFIFSNFNFILPYKIIKNTLLNSFLNFVFFFKKTKFKNFIQYKWNPVFKQYSYYGYFKANSEQWNYSKTEELKKYKF